MNAQPIKPSMRIQLGPSASAALSASGETNFAVVSRQTHPDNPARWAIHLYPLPDAVIRDMWAVMRGTHHAARNRADKTSATDPHP